MLKVPRLSAPLAKAIRTSEGILVYLVNIGLAAGSVIDPSKLPAKEAAIVGAGLTGLHVASRTLLKIAAVQKGLVPQLSSPIEPPALSQLEGPLKRLVEQAVQDIGHGVTSQQAVGQLVSDAEEFASQPTAPAAASGS